MYCRYGELQSNSRGDFMKCPSDCECLNSNSELSRPETVVNEASESMWAYAMVGLFISGLIYVIYLMVDALAAFNAMMG